MQKNQKLIITVLDEFMALEVEKVIPVIKR